MVAFDERHAYGDVLEKHHWADVGIGPYMKVRTKYQEIATGCRPRNDTVFGGRAQPTENS